MKSVTLIIVAVAMVCGMVAADYGSYGGGYASYMPAYGYGTGSSGLNNNSLYMFGFLFLILMVIISLNNDSTSNVTISG